MQRLSVQNVVTSSRWNKMVVDYGDFKGNKMIILKASETDEYPFQFGKKKAKLIVENFEAIKDFAEND